MLTPEQYLEENPQILKSGFLKSLSTKEIEEILDSLGGDSKSFLKYTTENIQRMRITMEIKKILGIKDFKKDNSVIKQELLEGFENYLDSQEELSEDNINMMKFLPALLELQNQKSLIYGRSYCKYGDFSVFMNTQRKWDRIENIMQNAMKEGMDTLFGDKSSTPTETFVDTVVDLASYGCLWAAYIMSEHPTEYKQFLEANNLK